MSAFTGNPETLQNINTKQITCRLYKQFLPSYTPVINNLSVYSSYHGVYSLVYITGTNLFNNGATFVNFGQFKNIPVTFYSSFNISFVVPINAPAGNYNVVAVNVYNDSFSSPIHHTYPGHLDYSNSLTYTLT
jgi:hypothetical protein